MTTTESAVRNGVDTATLFATREHPKVLTGADMAPTPVEFLLHALAGCLALDVKAG